MKAQRNLFVLMILTLLSTVPVSANNTTSPASAIVKIKAIDAQSIAIQLANLHQQKTVLTVKDISGISWYTKVIRKEHGYAKKLDLSALPNGLYIIAINNSSGVSTRIFSRDATSFTVYEASSLRDKNAGYAMLTGTSKSLEQTLITHITTPGNKDIGVQLANLGGACTKVSVRSIGGAIKLKDEIKNEYGYAKRLNLNGLNDGHFYIHIQTGQLSQVQFFTIENDQVILEDYYLLNAKSQTNT